VASDLQRGVVTCSLAWPASIGSRSAIRLQVNRVIGIREAAQGNATTGLLTVWDGWEKTLEIVKLGIAQIRSYGDERAILSHQNLTKRVIQ
jgi:hypothetical protein